MAKKLIIWILILGHFSVFAQKDLIITQAGKEIRCKILEENSMRFVYAYIDNGKVLKSEIFKTLVSNYVRDFYPDDILPNEKLFKSVVKPVEEKKIKAEEVKQEVEASTIAKEEKVLSTKVEPVKSRNDFKNYLKLRVGAKGGIANLIEKVGGTSSFDLLNEKLARGWVYGADAAWFINDYVGLGVVYNVYTSKQKSEHVEGVRWGQTLKGSFESKVSHRFIGPGLWLRIPIDYKTFLTAVGSPGYIYYSNTGHIQEQNYHYKQRTFGGAASLGLDFLLGDDDLGRDVILSFECGFLGGKVSQLNFGEPRGVESLSSPINLKRMDFSVGIRFSRFPKYLK